MLVSPLATTGANQVDIDAVSEGNFGVMTAITHVLNTLGNNAVAFFLDQVTERGEQLWLRFKTFQGDRQNIGFDDFVRDTITSAATIGTKLFYPKDCTLDQMTRGFLVSEVQRVIQPLGLKSNDQVLGIYFGKGPAYEAARKVTCKGCPMEQCPHFINPFGKKR